MLATRKRNLTSILMTLVLTVSLLAGCGANATEEKIVRDVLAATYAGPEQAYADAFAKYDEEVAAAQKAAGDDAATINEENNSLMKHMKARFGSVMTDSAYTYLLSNRTASAYPQRCIAKSWTTELKDVKLQVREAHRYAYTATVVFHLNAEKTESKEVTVSGNIDFDDAGKIRWFKPGKSHTNNEMMTAE